MGGWSSKRIQPPFWPSFRMSLSSGPSVAKTMEDHVEGQRINAFDAVKVKTKSEVQAGF